MCRHDHLPVAGHAGPEVQRRDFSGNVRRMARQDLQRRARLQRGNRCRNSIHHPGGLARRLRARGRGPTKQATVSVFRDVDSVGNLISMLRVQPGSRSQRTILESTSPVESRAIAVS